LKRSYVLIAAALLAPVPWVVLRLAGVHAAPLATVLLSGVAILASAFLLSWAAEVAQMDISQSLAMAFLALIAILPEYSVDMTFAWRAGQDPRFAPYAVANMTGANRLLIGLGWSSVVLAACWRTRQRSVNLAGVPFLELGLLWAATLYSLVLPIKGTLSLIDAVVLLLLFGYYMRVASKAGRSEPELVGPAECIGALPRSRRRGATLALFLVAAGAICLSAGPFAHGLVLLGQTMKVDRFLLVQWVAPLASEAPEFLVAGLLALRGKGRAGLSVMISSKVNQWTLLVGLLPVVYGASTWFHKRHLDLAMRLDGRQTEELLLTSAQSAFAAALLQRGHLSWRGAVALLGLFVVQFAVTDTRGRILFAIAYLVMTLLILGWHFLGGRWREARG
jgi:cation:H+ antiporter